MRFAIFFIFVLPCSALAGDAGSATDTLTIDGVVREALGHNPEIRAAEYEMDVQAAVIPQAGSLTDPSVTYMREEMPGFRWGEAGMQRVEVMQMIPFPGKLATKSALASITAEHAHHQHLEVVNSVMARAKMAFVDLWAARESTRLTREHRDLLERIAAVAGTRYSVGKAPQSDVLKVHVEMSLLENDLLELGQRETESTAQLFYLLGRPVSGSAGAVLLGAERPLLLPLDTVQALARDSRPMLVHDSLAVEESRSMLSLAQKEYIPDFTVGIQYKDFPQMSKGGWGIAAGITLPFAPWTLGKAAGRVEEAEASIRRSSATYAASRAMVAANVRSLYDKAHRTYQQLQAFRTTILPEAQQALTSTISGYENDRLGYTELIDAYRTLIRLRTQEVTTRADYEKTIAGLEMAAGFPDLLTLE